MLPGPVRRPEVGDQVSLDEKQNGVRCLFFKTGSIPSMAGLFLEWQNLQRLEAYRRHELRSLRGTACHGPWTFGCTKCLPSKNAMSCKVCGIGAGRVLGRQLHLFEVEAADTVSFIGAATE